ncbi:MAG: carboxymuconolactone decarboxylase family protein [Novosphingobium sp.]
MEPFPVLSKDQLDEKQRALWDELTLGPRGFYTGGAEAKRLPDLYNAWLQFPEFGELMVKLGGTIRANSALPGRLRELIVLTTSARLGALVEFDFHVPFAENEDLSGDVIAALRAGGEPAFVEQDERIAYMANLQLLATGALEPDIREEAIAAFGYPGVMALIAIVSMYVVTAYTTNVARVKLAEDFSADPDKLKDFFAGKDEAG